MTRSHNKALGEHPTRRRAPRAPAGFRARLNDGEVKPLFKSGFTTLFGGLVCILCGSALGYQLGSLTADSSPLVHATWLAVPAVLVLGGAGLFLYGLGRVVVTWPLQVAFFSAVLFLAAIGIWSALRGAIVAPGERSALDQVHLIGGAVLAVVATVVFIFAAIRLVGSPTTCLHEPAPKSTALFFRSAPSVDLVGGAFCLLVGTMFGTMVSDIAAGWPQRVVLSLAAALLLLGAVLYLSGTARGILQAFGVLQSGDQEYAGGAYVSTFQALRGLLGWALYSAGMHHSARDASGLGVSPGGLAIKGGLMIEGWRLRRNVRFHGPLNPLLTAILTALFSLVGWMILIGGASLPPAERTVRALCFLGGGMIVAFCASLFLPAVIYIARNRHAQRSSHLDALPQDDTPSKIVPRNPVR
jgi:hypothetical protein